MSQENIDAFLEHLSRTPEDRNKVKHMKGKEVVAYAELLGYKFTLDELKARLALDHLIRGT